MRAFRVRTWTVWSAVAMLTLGCSDPADDTAGSGSGLPSVPDTTSDLGEDAGSQRSSDVAVSDAGAAQVKAVECVPPGAGDCDENSECGSDFYCDSCQRKCLTPRKLCDPCTSNEQCALADQGSACVPYASGGSYCGRACLSDAGCPQGNACKEVVGASVKQCVPKTGDCAPAAGACTADGDCPFSTICAAEYGQCIKGCAADEECPGGKVCSLFRCVEPCTSDADCAKRSTEATCVDQHCVIPGGCLGPSDCPEKATYCDVEDHKCKPGCQTDFDCKEFGKKCEVGACVQKGCDENWECAFDQVCKPATGACEKPPEPYCGSCDAGDQEAKACGGAPAKCVSLKDENDKDVGDFCFLPCKSDPAGPCPQGYQCQDIKDQDGKSQGQFCVRQCWIDPLAQGN